MTPEETSLARLLVALPGFPKFDEIGGVHVGSDHASGYPLWFANDLVWIGVDLDARGEWIRAPLLTHMGTAGILLGMLEAAAPGRIGVEMRPGEPYKIAVFQRDQRAKWGGPMSYIEGPSLGVAAARVLVALGRAA